MGFYLTDERSFLRGRETLPDGHQEDGHGEKGCNAQSDLSKKTLSQFDLESKDKIVCFVA